MKKIQMKSDVTNSLLGFGCMRFPTKNGKIDREKAFEMLEYAYNHGVTHFDTAYPYHGGESELVVGEFLKRYDRASFTLSTKLPVWFVKEYSDFEKYLDEQLSKLQVEYLDFYLLHALNKGTWKNIKDLDVFKFVEEAKAKGKIRYIGFSFHDDKDTFQEIGNAYPWDFSLQQINYLDYKIQQGVEGYELMTQKNIPVWVMEPLKGGRLTTLAPDILDVYKEVEPDSSSAEWAFRWVHTLPNVKMILSGMSTLDQVESNCQIFEAIEPLNEKGIQAVDKVRDMINNRVKVACTGCNYCMPCPHGVNIPRNFSIYNDAYMYNNMQLGKDGYKYQLKEEEKALSCIECGECLAKCPQMLDIPNLLKEVVEHIGE